MTKNHQNRLFRYDADVVAISSSEIQKETPFSDDFFSLKEIKKLKNPIQKLDNSLKSLQGFITMCYKDHFSKQETEVILNDMKNIIDQLKEAKSGILEKLKKQGLNNFKTLNYGKEDMVHALKGPLGRIEVLYTIYANEKNRTFLEFIEKEINIAQELLAVDLTPRNHNLYDEVQNVRTNLIGDNRKHLNFHTHIPKELNVYMSKSLLIGPILDSLLSNAIKFTPEHGTITIHAKQRNTKIELKISDTGKGIPQEKMDQIFQGYTSAQDNDPDNLNGTGVGLQQTNRVVHELEGTLDVSSQVGKGTTFILTLPVEKN